MGRNRKNSFNEFIGKKFNSITVISYSKYQNGHHWLNCICDCGNNFDMQMGCIGKSNKCKNCKECKNHKKIVPEKYIGKKYGLFTIERYCEMRNYHAHYFFCRCECGNERKIYIGNLKNGMSKSCGCKPYNSKYSHLKDHHNMVNVWSGMIYRCYNISSQSYKYYGGRGIQVCDRWKDSFENFYNDMSPRPSKKHSIERKNNDGNYVPSNCRWATQKVQSKEGTQTLV